MNFKIIVWLMNMDSLIKYYHILGLPPHASFEEIKKAYRTLVKKYHPDCLNPNATPDEVREAYDRFHSITEAYSILQEHIRIRQHFKASSDSSYSTTKDPHNYNPYTNTTKMTSGQKKRCFNYYVWIWGFGVVVIISLCIWAIMPELKDPIYVVERPLRVVTLLGESGVSSKEIDGLKNTVRPHVVYPGHEGFFGLYASEEQVLRVQGVPDRVSGNTWFYGLSTIVFRNGRVVGYDNFDGRLKVQIIPPKLPQEIPSCFSLGSRSDIVLLVQGTPTRITGNIWFYGLDRITLKDGYVVGYDNLTGRLKVKILPAESYRSQEKREYFSLGSSVDEVVAVQGTPTRVNRNRWYYGLSEVVFRGGKVVWANNVSQNLKCIALEIEHK